MTSKTRETITPKQFRTLTRPLVGLTVTRPWRGYGSAIFMELGQLHREPFRTRTGGYSLKGQATIMIQWSWRVERQRSIAFGSWSGNRKITNGVAKLKDHSVEEIQLEGHLPELYMTLSDNLWVHSFATTESQPEWAVFLFDGSWIAVNRGRIIHAT